MKAIDCDGIVTRLLWVCDGAPVQYLRFCDLKQHGLFLCAAKSPDLRVDFHLEQRKTNLAITHLRGDLHGTLVHAED